MREDMLAPLREELQSISDPNNLKRTYCEPRLLGIGIKLESVFLNISVPVSNASNGQLFNQL